MSSTTRRTPRVLARWFGAITRDNPDAVILDFFAGSGSTGHAVMDLNAADGGHRRYILVQLDEAVDHPDYDTIASIARERLRRAGAQAKQAAGLLGADLDVGFRSLHVATTNMADTLATADDLLQVALSDAVGSVKPDRTDEDLLFQVLLDWGLDLAEPIAVEEVGARRVLSVADDALIACFADEVTDAVVQGDRQPAPAARRVPRRGLRQRRRAHQRRADLPRGVTRDRGKGDLTR